MQIELYGTKERIFNEAINLIATKGFESVSMRDIAEEVGIKVSSIYNHFSSKAEILDTIYGYFKAHRLDNRSDANGIKTTIETGSPFDIVNILYNTVFVFEEELEEKMNLIFKIILMRVFDDPKANHFFTHEWYKEDFNHLKTWLNYAVEIGRLETGFDIDNFSILLWNQMIMMSVWAFAYPDHESDKLIEKKRLFEIFARLLPLKAATTSNNE